jgi:tetratricopeptide (TPR) repeat protein
MKQRVSAETLFETTQPKEFVDRTEIKEKVITACDCMLNAPQSYFKVIDIYGIGGIGKTRLIAELEEEIKKKLSGIRFKMVSISFEIEGRQQALRNLILIRRSFKESCTVFDYALMTYWDKSCCLERLDNDFMYTIREGFFSGLADATTDVSGSILNIVVPAIPGIPSLSDIFNCVGNLIQKAQRFELRDYLKSISKLTAQELLQKIPLFLGFDIERLQRKKQEPLLVFLFDSYQQSAPYSESKEWLMELVSQIHQGLFLITGREKLKWNDPEKDIFPYHLQSYPENAARELLEKYIPDAGEEVVKEILISTQCVPLFVDMAIDVYQHEPDVSKIMESTYFTDRDQLTSRFIYHLPEKWQDILLDLSVIRIFNREIFLHLGKELGHACPIEDYEEIISTSISNYVERASGLVKLHDVFCYHATRVLSQVYKTSVWYHYLEFIRARGGGILDAEQNETLLTLFLNLLHLCKELNPVFTTQMTEWLLDIFFEIMDARAFFEPPLPGSGASNNLNDILLLVNAVIYEKVSTNETIRLLSEIKNPDRFGRHYKSYLILLQYSNGLVGNYYAFYSTLEQLDHQLTNGDSVYWYYPKIKIYLGDFMMMEGKFRAAFELFLDIKNTETSADNYYQAERVIGHIYRFNMDLEMAQQSYQSLLTQYNSSINTRVYLQTNLCETYCFFQPDRFDEIYEKTLRDIMALGNLKNLGKLYYSRAIVLASRGQLKKAYAYIQRSLGVNQKDGYQSGELFAYMARAYCDYAKYGLVRENTLEQIEKLMIQNKVYTFFRLPLCMMAGDQQAAEDLRLKYEWLDFNGTVNRYSELLARLRSPGTS